jgi:hypothetical protein
VVGGMIRGAVASVGSGAIAAVLVRGVGVGTGA